MVSLPPTTKSRFSAVEYVDVPFAVTQVMRLSVMITESSYSEVISRERQQASMGKSKLLAVSKEVS